MTGPTSVIMWCSACHGYGHDPFTLDDCTVCNGLGGFNIDTDQPVRWIPA